MPVYDACLDADVRIVHSRHESGAVFMAEAWAQLSGKCGVALVTAAPGFANALGAIYSSKMSCTPLLLLSGDSPVAQDGTGAFQEFAQSHAIEPLVKYTYRITDTADIPVVVAEAVRIASDDIPGPVHLALPFDVLNTQVAEGLAGCYSVNKSKTEDPFREADLDAVWDRISGASRPVIFTGPQFNRTRAPGAITELEANSAIPVVCIESPRGLNDPSLGSVAELLQISDCVLYLGKEINFQTGFAASERMPEASLLLVHPDEQVIAANKKLLGNRLVSTVVSNSIEAAHRFAELAKAGSKTGIESGWSERVNQALSNRKLRAYKLADSDEADSATRVHPAKVGQAVQAVLDENADSVLLCDGGEFGQWAQGFANASHRIINGGSGAIGGSIPYAVGACVARPDAAVIAMLGDGTAGFYLAEFETAVRAGVHPVYIIGNDARWNAEYQIQIRDYGADRTYACELSESTDYAAVANALGGIGLTVDHPDALFTTLQRAVDLSVQKQLPVCVDVALLGLSAPVYHWSEPSESTKR